MKLRDLGVAFTAISLAAAATGSAQAAITVPIAPQAHNLFGPLSLGQVMLEDFDVGGFNNANTLYVGTVRNTIENPISTSAPPPYPQALGGAATQSNGSTIYVDPTPYASVQANGIGSLTILNGYWLQSFSFYMGSPDTYNHVRFYVGNTEVGHLQGAQIWDAATYGNTPGQMGDRTWGYRVYYDFGGAKVDKITFTTESTNAFEFDGLAGNLAVPEPTTWALMIMGFGGAGAMLRANRRRLVAG